MNFEESLVVELSTILPDKIFPIQVRQDIALPIMVFTLNSVNREMVMDGFDGLIDASYQLDIYHNHYTSLKTLMDTIIQKLKTFNFRTLATTGVYCQSLFIEDEVETYDPTVNEYQGTIDIQVSYQE